MTLAGVLDVSRAWYRIVESCRIHVTFRSLLGSSGRCDGGLGIMLAAAASRVHHSEDGGGKEERPVRMHTVSI